MSLKGNIRQILTLIQKVIAQAPIDKQPMIASKISRVVEKYSNLDGQINDPSYLKELQFNLNFLKLSFPHLDYSPPQQNKPAETPSEPQEESRATEDFFQLQNKEQMRKFMEETEKVMKGVRDEVEFTNWSAGNIDPENLKRHKQLLKRQHFGGQFWADKPKPVSPTAAFLMNMMQNEPERRHDKIEVEEDKPVTFASDPDKRWQKVKR